MIILTGIFQIFPLLFAVYYHFIDADDVNTIHAFIYSIIFAFFSGGILYIITKKFKKVEVKIRESFAIVTFGWIIAALFASIPFMIQAYLNDYPTLDPISNPFSLHGYPFFNSINSFTDAYFEMMSGFTTTGSSIIIDIESIPKGLLFWRSLTHWLGGMGIILLAVAILPALGVGGMQLYQAEVPGPISSKITPRVSQTAKILWGVYLLFTAVETILLMFGGMDFFDSLCHTFGSLATGGFSTKNLSISYYQSSYIDYVIIVFMFLSGANFTLHYQFLRKQYNVYFKDREFLFYSSIILFSTLIILLDNTFLHNVDGFNGGIADSIRLTLFQVISITTTTGYGVGLNDESLFHFALWSTASQFLMIMLMIAGGSAGSTGGGVKSLRVYLSLKFIYNEIIKFIYPRHIKLIRIGKDVIPDSIILSTIGFIMIHITVAGFSTLIMNFFEKDLITSFSSVMATLNNVGPGLGKVGPDSNFANISTAGKWILTFCMLLGRLELYSVIILLFPVAWRKT